MRSFCLMLLQGSAVQVCASVECVHKGLLPAPVHIYSLESTHAYRGLLRAEISRMP